MVGWKSGLSSDGLGLGLLVDWLICWGKENTNGLGKLRQGDNKIGSVFKKKEGVTDLVQVIKNGTSENQKGSPKSGL